MHEYKKLYTLLQMISSLAKGEGLTVARLAQRYGTTKKTIYRHLDLLKECGFQLEKDADHSYRVIQADEVFQQEGITFSVEEAGIIKDAVMAVQGTHPLRNNILSKLFAHSELDAAAEVIYNKLVGRNIAQLTKAINENNQVILKQYHSLNSDTIADRQVEPTGFVNNMRYLTAYEPETERVLQFKADRAERVEVLDTPRQYGRTVGHQHPDIFGMNGTPVVKAALVLSDRGKHLLLEEYPMAANGMEEFSQNARARWTGTVKGFELSLIHI